MGKLLKWLLWTSLFLLIMLGIDQFFVQVPPVHPAHAAVSQFYQDFRQRLSTMLLDEPPDVTKPATIRLPPKSIETVIDKQTKAEPSHQASPEKTQRYIYTDEQGALQFAESLEEVPLQYRATAQPLSQ